MRISAIVLALFLTASSASAQSLKVPTVIFVSAASADWISTGVSLSRGGTHESNPMLTWSSRPASIIATGATMDAAGLWLVHRFVAPHHPKLAVVGLYAASALRLSFVARNVAVMR